MAQAQPRIDQLTLEQLVELRNAVDKRITQERQQLQSLLARVDSALDSGSSTPVRRPSGVRPPLGRRRVAAARGRRGRRGEGWAIVERALRELGGKGTTADMKSAWVGRKTPLSVALVSYLKSGKITKKGAGRGAVYSLAGGGSGETGNGRARTRRTPRRARRGRPAKAEPAAAAAQ